MFFFFFLFKLCKISTFPLEKKIILNNKGSIKKHLVAKHRNFLVKIRNSIMDTDISLFLGQRVVIKRYCVVHHTPARGNMKNFQALRSRKKPRPVRHIVHLQPHPDYKRSNRRFLYINAYPHIFKIYKILINNVFIKTYSHKSTVFLSGEHRYQGTLVLGNTGTGEHIYPWHFIVIGNKGYQEHRHR